MSQLLTTDPGALRMLMTEELFLVTETESQVPLTPEKKTDPPIPTVELAVDFSYLGENNKYFLILVNDDTHKHLNKEHQEMLLKIIQAKGLELRDVAILNLNRYPAISLKALKEFFAPSRLVLFGIDPNVLGLPQLASNEPVAAEDVKTLSTYSFEEMGNDVAKKRTFWNVLKTF